MVLQSRLLILFKPKNQFLSIQWTEIAFVLRSIEELFKNYPIKVKIGIVPSLKYLQEIVLALKRRSPKQASFGTPF
jgi:hydroxymethylpyrimidine/phosphomethylpyrimidine kinase